MTAVGEWADEEGELQTGQNMKTGETTGRTDMTGTLSMGETGVRKTGEEIGT